MNAPVRFTPAFSTDACDRVLAAVRWWFRKTGRSPSFGNIAELATIHKGRIRRHLDALQAEGFLTHTPGVARSIVLVDRGAMMSDAEVIALAVGRNLVVGHPIEIGVVLGNAIPADTREVGTDCPLSDLLAKLDEVPSPGEGHDGTEVDEDPNCEP